MNSEQQYIELYNDVSEQIKARSCDVMNSHRSKAFDFFCQKGLPTQKEERYKYTDLQSAFAPDYGIALVAQPFTPSNFLMNLKDAPSNVSSLYNTIADPTDGLASFNTAFSHDCLVVHVGKNQKADQPILINYWMGGNIMALQLRRLLIVMEEGAEATVVINDRAKDQQTFLSSRVIEIHSSDNSHLDLFDIEDTVPTMNRLSNTYFNMGRNCTVKHNSITLFNGMTRNLCDVRLKGEGSEVTLNGCAIATGTQHIDNNTLIDHISGFCTSNELYKYVVDNDAVGAFAGRILVEKDAQKTSSQETNANLCASPNARMYTQPMLEIYADDVKCSHGSTVGVMDENALFYMRQRGINEEEARTLLKNAFLGQVIEQIQDESLRNKLAVKIEKRFRGELEKCGTCQLCK